MNELMRELDFENIVYPSELGQDIIAVCESCNATHYLAQSGIWQCEVCDHWQHKDIEL